MRDTFGYNAEFKTLIVAKKSYNIGKYEYKLSKTLLYEYEKGNVELILVIPLSFKNNFYEMVLANPQMRVMLVTMEDLFKEDHETVLPRLIEEINNPTPGPLSKIFKILK